MTFPTPIGTSTETCVSMVDMKFVQRCTTKIYSRHYQRLCPKYAYVILHAAPKPNCPNGLSVYSDGAVQLTLRGVFFFKLLDFIDFGAIYRLPQNGARERTEGGIRIRRKCHYHFVVSLVSRLSRVRPTGGLLPPTPRVA
jgi:hypothetical protein